MTRLFRICLLAAALVVHQATAYVPAQPVNTPLDDAEDARSTLALRTGGRDYSDRRVSLQMAGEESNGTTSGSIVHFTEYNATHQRGSGVPWIAFISCDANATQTTSEYDVFSYARDRGARSVLLYSLTAERCAINSEFLDTYERVIDVYATTTQKSALLINSQFDGINNTYYWYNSSTLNDTNAAAAVENGPALPYLWATLTSWNSTVVDTDGNGGGGGGHGGGSSGGSGGGSKPNTGLAMIILYAITGIVTALFLIVILSGAVRAIRHPERYGPRAGNPNLPHGDGAPQTRAAGITRAILDTFPVVKFGSGNSASAGAGARTGAHVEGEEERRRKWDPEEGHEMEGIHRPDAAATAAPVVAASRRSRDGDEADKEMDEEADGQRRNEASPAQHDAAEGTDVHPSAMGRETCPICVEDFEEGDDVRILPCEGHHRFHAHCIDQWLLQVSSLCPLCRQDFRLIPGAAPSSPSSFSPSSSSPSSSASNSNSATPHEPHLNLPRPPSSYPPLTTGDLAASHAHMHSSPPSRSASTSASTSQPSSPPTAPHSAGGGDGGKFRKYLVAMREKKTRRRGGEDREEERERQDQ